MPKLGFGKREIPFSSLKFVRVAELESTTELEFTPKLVSMPKLEFASDLDRNAIRSRRKLNIVKTLIQKAKNPKIRKINIWRFRS